jgi:hypothetical protein
LLTFFSSWPRPIILLISLIMILWNLNFMPLLFPSSWLGFAELLEHVIRTREQI